MQAARIKRGATFRATLSDFSDEEWAAIHPWDSIKAEVGQGSRRYPLTVTTDPATRTITLTAADTSLWLVAPASFDVWVTRGSTVQPIPSSTNIPLSVVEGITR